MNSTVDSNTAAFNGFPTGGGAGGGIFNAFGTLTIDNSVVTNNLAGVPDPFASAMAAASLTKACDSYQLHNQQQSSLYGWRWYRKHRHVNHQQQYH